MSKKSPYDRGFKIRMGVLSTILIVVAVLYALDRFVMIPSADTAIAKMTQGEFDEAADHKAQIRELAGKEPVKSSEVHIYELEDYEFGRVLPFLAPRKATVVYRDSRVVEVVQGEFTKKDLAKYEYQAPRPNDPGGPPAMNMGSAGPTHPPEAKEDEDDSNDTAEEKEKKS